MRVLFVEGRDQEALLALARELPHPYWLLEGEGVWLLEVYGAGEEVERKAKALPDLKVWVFRLRDGVVYRGCGKRSATSP